MSRDEVGAVVAEAAALQDAAARLARDRVAPEEIARVAAELGVDPGFVETAIARRRAAAEQVALAERARGRTLRMAARVLLSILALGGVVATIGWGVDRAADSR
ncbi:hypothetical protein RZS08_43010, partial [Arthrospira platensis SPKY1]|nr:hypothetical protein [Arthrospira platensis SPKY1]